MQEQPGVRVRMLVRLISALVLDVIVLALDGQRVSLVEPAAQVDAAAALATEWHRVRILGIEELIADGAADERHVRFSAVLVADLIVLREFV